MNHPDLQNIFATKILLIFLTFHMQGLTKDCGYIPFIDRNVITFFYVSLYTDYLSNLHKNFHVTSPYDEKWIFVFFFLLVMLLTHTQRERERERDQPLKAWFSNSGDIKKV